MSSSSALVSYLGSLSPAERAARRWFGVELLETEEARHERLMSAIRNIDPDPAPVPLARPPWKPGKRWRYEAHESQNRLRSYGCMCCLGTGVMKIYIDRPEAPCASCQEENPYARERGDHHGV